MRLLDNGQLNLFYNIVDNGGTNLPLGQIKDFSTSYKNFEGGLITALARTTFNNNKIIIASSRKYVGLRF